MLQQLEPRAVFHWFEELTKIPRCSYHEEKVAEFIRAFAEERGLWVHVDGEHNVIVKKEATSGREHAPAVILQGHLDMVCEKVPGCAHDFSKDPIPLVVEDGWVKTKGTTLGADDGIAVAYILAILDAKDIVHGPIEALFTTAEEMSMEGAAAVTSEHLSGRYLLNIDGEVEGDLLVGCSSGFPMEASRTVQWIDAPQGMWKKLRIEHLVGGHSGQEIHRSRANAIKLLARLLKVAGEGSIAALSGGNKHNAIPVEAEAVFRTTGEGWARLEKRAEVIRKEHAVSDPELSITLSDIPDPQRCLSREDAQATVNFLIAIPDGVQYMDPSFSDLVQTSLSNGILRLEDDRVHLVTLLRSSQKSAEEEIYERFRTIGEVFGFDVTDEGGSPSWEYDPHSALLAVAKEVYTAQYGEAPRVKTIHCSLECGILKLALPETDMITFGPDMLDIHTPRERLDIKSTERVFTFTCALLDALSKNA